MKILFSICCAFCASYVSAQGYTYDGKVANFVETRTYRFAGGICYESRYSYQPNMVTYATAMPEFMTDQHISNCLKEMRKAKWKDTNSTATLVIDNLREARTANMACMHIGVAQQPMLYQVTFAHFALTGKQEELVDCMSKSAEAPNRAILLPVGKHVDL